MTADYDPERRLDRAGIAARLTERLGHPVSVRTVPELPIPFKVILKKATSTLGDVDTYADELIAKAALRVGSPRTPAMRQKQGAHPNEAA